MKTRTQQFIIPLAIKSRFAFFALGLIATVLASHAQNKGLRFVPSPQISGQLLATAVIAAISASYIWAVGFNATSFGGLETLTEHWNGTSWKIINSPNPGNFKNGLFGVSTLSDGTVAAVGFQQDQGFDAIPLILEN